MVGQEKIQRSFMIRVRHAADPDTYVVHYVPRGLQQLRERGGDAKRIPEYKASAHVEGNDIVLTWHNPPTDLEADQEQFAHDATERVRLLHDWLCRLSTLVATVESWAKELGWSTRRIEKPMKDSEIGEYRAPALLLQEETIRIMLEPIGRSSPGTEGIVDLYLLPAYDDIATLCYYDDRWNLHYIPPSSESIATIREAEGKPLSKKTLRTVLAELKKHVG
jgi:hypothetical protein